MILKPRKSCWFIDIFVMVFLARDHTVLGANDGSQWEEPKDPQPGRIMNDDQESID